jgi:hypothetical protein
MGRTSCPSSRGRRRAQQRRAAAVPNRAVMNHGLIAANLIDCIAAMSWGADKRPSARINVDVGPDHLDSPGPSGRRTVVSSRDPHERTDRSRHKPIEDRTHRKRHRARPFLTTSGHVQVVFVTRAGLVQEVAIATRSLLRSDRSRSRAIKLTQTLLRRPRRAGGRPQLDDGRPRLLRVDANRRVITARTWSSMK